MIDMYWFPSFLGFDVLNYRHNEPFISDRKNDKFNADKVSA